MLGSIVYTDSYHSYDNGIPRKNFHLFLKECEFRFNYGNPKQQLKTLLDWANF